ncbi:hypothetical protein PPTG_21899 [Phytophthora nicotianae INRA-310]|uniref:Uncharacterized protein n=1 Tax=Phytophthora nicotianae (strain INRA-310) TaxID=761204 RepID=W2QTD2_PHYN3|nr:hypothetical protein PPTG_21899 [Phytophthora nicotianae INRA-310]ETN16338.1 hypothetical protein PPTG_21899 [Phytophthora nicotianae INRA-310]
MELHVVAATRPATDDNMADDGRFRVDIESSSSILSSHDETDAAAPPRSFTPTQVRSDPPFGGHVPAHRLSPEREPNDEEHILATKLLLLLKTANLADLPWKSCKLCTTRTQVRQVAIRMLVVNNPVSLIAEKHKKNVALVVYRKEDKNAAVYAADIREDNMPDPENPLDVN